MRSLMLLMLDFYNVIALGSKLVNKTIKTTLISLDWGRGIRPHGI